MRGVREIINLSSQYTVVLNMLVMDVHGHLTCDRGYYYWISPHNVDGVFDRIHANLLRKMADDEVIEFRRGCSVKIFTPVVYLIQGFDARIIFPESTGNVVSDIGTIDRPTESGMILLSVISRNKKIPVSEWRSYRAESRWSIA